MDSVIRIPDWALTLRDAIKAYNEDVIPALEGGDYVSAELTLNLYVVPCAVNGYRRSLTFDAGTVGMYSLGLAARLKVLHNYLVESRMDGNYDSEKITSMMENVDERLPIVEMGVNSVIKAFDEKCRETEGIYQI